MKWRCFGVSSCPSGDIQMITVDQFNEYVERLDFHDWYYEFSDDNGVWLAGQAKAQSLRTEAMADPIFSELYKARYEQAFDREERGYNEARELFVAKVQMLRALVQAQEAVAQPA